VSLSRDAPLSTCGHHRGQLRLTLRRHQLHLRQRPERVALQAVEAAEPLLSSSAAMTHKESKEKTNENAKMIERQECSSNAVFISTVE
jgi:hypothetical protein